MNRLVSSRAMSTSTAISGCFQPGQAKVVLGPTPLGVTTRETSWITSKNCYTTPPPPPHPPTPHLRLFCGEGKSRPSGFDQQQYSSLRQRIITTLTRSQTLANVKYLPAPLPMSLSLFSFERQTVTDIKSWANSFWRSLKEGGGDKIDSSILSSSIALLIYVQISRTYLRADFAHINILEACWLCLSFIF